MTEELVLSLRHVTAGYREGGVLGRKRFHEVLHDVSFDVHRGEICGLVGESGTGKSTLARTILQMVKPEQGEVIAVGPGGMVDGKEVKMQVTVGQKVIYSKYAGTEVKLDGEEYIIVRQNDILAVVE